MEIVGAKKGVSLKAGNALTNAKADIGITSDGTLLLQLKFQTLEQAKQAALILTGELITK